VIAGVVFGVGLVAFVFSAVAVGRSNRRFKLAHEGPGGARKVLGSVMSAEAPTADSRRIVVSYPAMGEARVAEVAAQRGTGSEAWWANVLKQTNVGSRPLISYSKRAPDVARLVATEYGSPAEALRATWERVGIAFVAMWSSFIVFLVGAGLLLR